MATTAYTPVSSDADEDAPPIYQYPKPHETRRTYWTFVAALAGCVVFCLGFGSSFLLPALGLGTGSNSDKKCPCAKPSNVPQYFQTSPELWPGPTATGKAPFMAQTVTFNPTATYVPNEPLQTAIPVEGMTDQDDGIFKMMGYGPVYEP
jgi:hypothetical protein